MQRRGLELQPRHKSKMPTCKLYTNTRDVYTHMCDAFKHGNRQITRDVALLVLATMTATMQDPPVVPCKVMILWSARAFLKIPAFDFNFCTERELVQGPHLRLLTEQSKRLLRFCCLATFR